MSKKDKALMDIAQNNMGKIEEHEHHDKPVTFGLSVTKSLELGNRLAVFSVKVRLHVRRRCILHQSKPKGALFGNTFASVV